MWVFAAYRSSLGAARTHPAQPPYRPASILGIMKNVLHIVQLVQHIQKLFK